MYVLASEGGSVSESFTLDYSVSTAVSYTHLKEKDNIIISVKNTYDGKLNIKDGEIQTSKKYAIDEHGVGIKNIIELITKDQGFLLYTSYYPSNYYRMCCSGK